MITFNDKVQVDVSFLQNETGMYEWKVYELNPINENDTTEYTTTEAEIFRGTAFFVKKPGSGDIEITKQFDITSIVNQRKWHMRNLETQQNGRVNLANRYQIEVASKNKTYRSEIITVCFYHPYGNYTNIMDPYDGYVDYDEYSTWYAILAPLIQGAKEINTGIEPVFLPKIPRETSIVYVYPIVGLCSKSYHNKNIQLDCTGELTVSGPGPIGRYVPYYANEYAPAWLHKFSLRQIRNRGVFRPVNENVIANFVETGKHNFNEQWVDTPSNEYVWTMDNATLTYHFSTYFKSGNNYSYIGTAANISPNQRLEGTLWIEQRHLNFIKRHTEPTTFTIMLHASEYDPDTDDDIDYNDYIEFDASWLKDIVLENNETISMPFELSYGAGGANSYLKFGADYHHYLKPEGEGNYLVAKINDSGSMIANLDEYVGCTVEAQEYNWLATIDYDDYDVSYNVVLTTEFPGVGEIEIELAVGIDPDGFYKIDVSNYKYLIERLFRVYGTPSQSTNYYLEFRPSQEGFDWSIVFDINDYVESWMTYGCEIECHSKTADHKTYLTIQIQHTDNIMTTKIAEIKDCIKYYLMWQDRAGGFQCQPFEKTETYSEDFSRAQWETYNNAKRLASVEVQPQWKLNTGFIDDKYYPYYESIFVSPYIELWDIENGTKRRVYVEDSKYTEKTFKNQGRQLFNLELTVKEDTKQHILY